jgi:hypothetical protein
MKLELSVHAIKLKNVAGLGKGTSDPFAVVTKIATAHGTKPQVLGKTEIVKNSTSPQWVKVFTLDYELGTPTKVAVNIFDEVRKGENKSMGGKSNGAISHCKLVQRTNLSFRHIISHTHVPV